MDVASALMKFEFFVLAPNDWNGQRMNRQQLFSRFARYSPIIYSNGLKHTWELINITNILSNPISHFEQCEDVQVDRPSSLLLRYKKLKFYDNIVLRAYSNHLTSRKNSNKKSILYIFHPQFKEYVHTIKHDILVYHPYDDFSKQGEGFSQHVSDEKYLVEKADIVITPSAGLSNNLINKYHRMNIKTVHNGVDFKAFSHYANKTINNQIKEPAKKRVGYIGSINVKVDIEMLLYLATRFPDVSFELIGPVGVMDNKKTAFEQLKNMDNVILWGSKPYDELPQLTAAMDCLLMCYDTSPELWAGLAYPLKLNEYLAVKVPVISCDLPSVPELNSLVDVATTHQQWATSLTEILTGNYSKQDTGFLYAAKQDWNARVTEIARLLNEIN